MRKIILIMLIFFSFWASMNVYAELIDNGDGTITDTNTDLMWLKNMNQSGQTKNWADANSWANNLVFAGYSDWRLPSGYNPDGTITNSRPYGANPTQTEFWSLYGGYNIIWWSPAPFENASGRSYWTSTEWPANQQNAMAQDMEDGGLLDWPKSNSYGAWAVRDIPIYIADFNDFPAYPYNTTSYKQGGAFVGCGPTTGAMMFGYFDHAYSSDLLHNPVAGVDEGLGTAWQLHSSSYMKTNSGGFGDVHDIEPGLENYADDKGEIVDAMIHVGTDYDPNSSDADWLNAYGPYGSSWNNDGDFWVHNLTNDTWTFDVEKFCDFVEPKLLLGIPIFLTIDTNMDKGGDHWVALVGVHRTDEDYYYYDTYSTTLQTGPIHYCGAPGAAQDNAISFLRTVTYTGEQGEQFNPPTSLAVLSGYHRAIPLAWKSPGQGSSDAGSKTIPMHPNMSITENITSDLNDQDSIQSRSFIKPIIEAEPQFMKKSKTTLHRSAENSISYNVYRSTSSGGSYSKIANNLNRTYYRDEPVANGQTYYYKVTAVYSGGESDFSNTVSGSAVSNGYYLNSGWASSAPNLNGNINSSEWSNAATTTITYPGESGTVTLYVMNDANYLYFAVNDVLDNSLDDDDTFGIFFDDNHNRELPSSTPSNEGLIQMFWDSGSNSAKNAFLGAYGYFPDNLHTDGWTTASGVSQGISQSSGHVHYESRIDLSSSPLKSSPGQTIGIAFYSWDGGGSSFTGLWPQAIINLQTFTSGFGWFYGPFSYGDIKLSSSTMVDDELFNKTPDKFALFQNYPNPFNPVTQISFDVRKNCHVYLRVYDILGKRVSTLVDRNMKTGHYNVEFNAAGLASGIYLYKIQMGGFSETRKMLLNR